MMVMAFESRGGLPLLSSEAVDSGGDSFFGVLMTRTT